MIYVDLGGRCGNQLFEYAFARKLQVLYGEPVAFNIYQYRPEMRKDDSFSCVLSDYNTAQHEIVDERNCIFAHGSIAQKLIYVLFRTHCAMPYKRRIDFYRRQERWQPWLNRLGIYYLARGYSEIRTSRAKNKFAHGSFEDKRWFDDVRSELLQEITPKAPESPKNADLYKVIRETESVCISIRRGDFMHAAHKDLRSICTKEYFIEAIRVMREKVPNAVFIAFSDEIEYVKEHFDLGDNCQYEDGTDEIWEKLRLMYSCKHFILSNSTFSWWPQYLSRSENKVVISPSRWFVMDDYTHSLIDKDWTFIEV